MEEIRDSDSGWRRATRAVLSSFAELETAKAEMDHQQLPRETPQPDGAEIGSADVGYPIEVKGGGC